MFCTMMYLKKDVKLLSGNKKIKLKFSGISFPRLKQDLKECQFYSFYNRCLLFIIQ